MPKPRISFNTPSLFFSSTDSVGAFVLRIILPIIISLGRATSNTIPFSFYSPSLFMRTSSMELFSTELKIKKTDVDSPWTISGSLLLLAFELDPEW